MTKIFLPTEIGVAGEGSNSLFNDADLPEVKVVKPGQDPAEPVQPEFYKRIRDIADHDLTLAEERTGVDNTRNQTSFDEEEVSDAPKGASTMAPKKTPAPKAKEEGK